MAKAKAAKEPGLRKQLAEESVLPVRKELVAAFAAMQRHLLATVTNPGEMGNVSNWQQQTLPAMLTTPGQELAKLLGGDLPADAVPSQRYQGGPRLFVPEVRTGIVSGEPVKLTSIILGGEPQKAAVRWRPLGAGSFAKVPLTHVARGVYAATLPREAGRADFEYYVEATVGGRGLVFPATAPTLNQSVVVEE